MNRHSPVQKADSLVEKQASNIHTVHCSHISQHRQMRSLGPIESSVQLLVLGVSGGIRRTLQRRSPLA